MFVTPLCGIVEVVGVNRSSERVYTEKRAMLDEMFRVLKSALPVGSYAMKGGYVLNTILTTESKVKDFRRTSDIDLDVASAEYFSLIVDGLTPLLKLWVADGRIYKYSISTPKGKATGSIKLYRKRDENTKAFVFCGIDVGVHSLEYGIAMLKDGMGREGEESGLPCYAIERMLADKFWSMYYTVDRKVLYHRVRDLLDIYLIGRYLGEKGMNVDLELLIQCVRERMKFANVDRLNSMSRFALAFLDDAEVICCLLEEEIALRVSPCMVSSVSVGDIICESLCFINFVLGVV